jgi:hypothetical protein
MSALNFIARDQSQEDLEHDTTGMDWMFEAQKLMLESKMARENEHVVADEAGDVHSNHFSERI